MKFNKFSGKSGMQQLLKAVIAIIFLSFYLTGNLSQGLFHDLVHVHEEVTHTAQDELDACHRVIYHDETEKACGHESHVSAKVVCHICDIVSPTDQDVAAISSITFQQISVSHQAIDLASLFTSLSFLLPARAPPVLS